MFYFSLTVDDDPVAMSKDTGVYANADQIAFEEPKTNGGIWFSIKKTLRRESNFCFLNSICILAELFVISFLYNLLAPASSHYHYYGCEIVSLCHSIIQECKNN